MDVLEVVSPVVEGWIERELLALRGGRLLPQRRHVAGVEDAVHLRIHAVELDEVQPAVESLTFSVQVVRDLGDARAEGQPLDEPLRGLDHAQRCARAGGHLLAGGIRPRGRADRLPVSIAQRILGEVGARLVDDSPEPQWIPAPRCRVIDTGLSVRWRIRSDREHRVDDEVGGDDVEQRVRQTREVAKDVAAEREDQRLGHPESLEPARKRFGKRALDDRRPHDRQRNLAVQLHHRVLGHRLGERVDIREPHRVGVDATALYEAILHPSIAQPLGSTRDRRRAGRAHP